MGACSKLNRVKYFVIACAELTIAAFMVTMALRDVFGELGLLVCPVAFAAAGIALAIRSYAVACKQVMASGKSAHKEMMECEAAGTFANQNNEEHSLARAFWLFGSVIPGMFKEGVLAFKKLRIAEQPVDVFSKGDYIAMGDQLSFVTLRVLGFFTRCSMLTFGLAASAVLVTFHVVATMVFAIVLFAKWVLVKAVAR